MGAVMSIIHARDFVSFPVNTLWNRVYLGSSSQSSAFEPKNSGSYPSIEESQICPESITLAFKYNPNREQYVMIHKTNYHLSIFQTKSSSTQLGENN